MYISASSRFTVLFYTDLCLSLISFSCIRNVFLIFFFTLCCTCEIVIGNWFSRILILLLSRNIIGKYFYLNAWCFYQINTQHPQWFVVIAIGIRSYSNVIIIIYIAFFSKILHNISYCYSIGICCHVINWILRYKQQWKSKLLL